jgi:hypothetical protein
MVTKNFKGNRIKNFVKIAELCKDEPKIEIVK